MTVPLARRMLAEFLGTALLVTALVGSGIMATRLSPDEVGIQLLQNSITTMLALTVLILIFAPVSGAHFNPVVTLAAWWLQRRSGGLNLRDLVGYVVAQTLGASSGAVLANAMFDLPAVSWSTTTRTGSHLWLGEVVATAGLTLLIFTLVRTGRAFLSAPAVGAYVGAAYWFTSSTAFANPAVTIGRALTDTFAGVAPGSVPAFVGAQVAGALIGLAVLLALYPDPASGPPRPRPQRTVLPESDLPSGQLGRGISLVPNRWRA